MRKIWTIAWKELYTTYTDRNLVLIMIATPLLVASIVALAFGGQGGVSIQNIPVAVVNLDEGSGGQNFGAIFVSAFVPPAAGAALAGQDAPACPDAPASGTAAGSALFELTDAVELDDADAARAAVDAGVYAAAVIIPPDFSRKIGYGPGDPVEPVSVEVYGSSGREVAAGIIRSVVESISSQIAAGHIAIAAALETVGQEYGMLRLLSLANSPEFAVSAACAFTPAYNTLTVTQQTVAGQRVDSRAALLVVVGSSQAMFFMLFTGQGGVFSVFEERRQGTLQRLIVSPTPRLVILVGKMVGTFVSCVLQLVFLFAALTLVGSLISGQLTLIWGDQVLAIALVIGAAALAATGLGTLLAGAARTPEQGQIFASVINLGLAVLGGAFGFVLPESVSRFSMIWWGSDAFRRLSLGQADIIPHLLVLLAHGVILFGIGFWLFNRRLDI